MPLYRLTSEINEYGEKVDLSLLIYLLYLLFQKKVESYKHMILWLDLSFDEPVTLYCELHWCFLGETRQLEETGVGYFPSSRYVRLDNISD